MAAHISINIDDPQIHTKPKSKMARTDLNKLLPRQLKAICLERHPPTKSKKKRELRAIIKKNDRRRLRQASRKENKRRRSDMKKLESLEKALGGFVINTKEALGVEVGGGSARGSTLNVPGVSGRLRGSRAEKRLRASERNAARGTAIGMTKGMRGRQNNRYQGLQELGTEDHMESETGLDGEMAIDTLTELSTTPAVLEQATTTNVAPQTAFPSYNGDIDEITLRIRNL